MADLRPASLMTPEQQLRAVQTKAQQARDLPPCGPWCLAGMVATLTAGTAAVAAAILLATSLCRR